MVQKLNIRFKLHFAIWTHKYHNYRLKIKNLIISLKSSKKFELCPALSANISFSHIMNVSLHYSSPLIIFIDLRRKQLFFLLCLRHLLSQCEANFFVYLLKNDVVILLINGSFHFKKSKL